MSIIKVKGECMGINNQKVFRTGDIVISNKTGLQGGIHYIVEKNGQTTFNCRAKDIKTVQMYNGTQIEHLELNEIILPEAENGK